MFQHVNLSHKFHEVMKDYTLIQEDYRDKTKVMIQRQLQVTTGKQVSEEDVEEMIEKGSIKVFTQDVSVANIWMCVWMVLFPDTCQYLRTTTGIK